MTSLGHSASKQPHPHDQEPICFLGSRALRVDFQEGYDQLKPVSRWSPTALEEPTLKFAKGIGSQVNLSDLIMRHRACMGFCEAVQSF